jgi:hypothetical protein
MCEDPTCPYSTVVIIFATYSNQIIHEIYLQRNVEVRSDFSLPRFQIVYVWCGHIMFRSSTVSSASAYFLHLSRQR